MIRFSNKMVNKCVVTNCKTGYSNGPKKSTFHFPEEFDLQKRWIYFVNRKDWGRYSTFSPPFFMTDYDREFDAD